MLWQHIFQWWNEWSHLRFWKESAHGPQDGSSESLRYGVRFLPEVRILLYTCGKKLSASLSIQSDSPSDSKLSKA